MEKHAANKHEDRRVVRTRKAIHEALLDLLQRKPLSKISTTELCSVAGINRNTFYSYYQTPDDVLGEMVGDYQDQISDHVKSVGPDDIYHATCEILHVLKENEKMCLVLGSGHSSGIMTNETLGKSKRAWFSQWGACGIAAPEAVQESVYAFVSMGYSSAVFRWLREGAREPVEDMARRLVDMSEAAMDAGFGAGSYRIMDNGSR